MTTSNPIDAGTISVAVESGIATVAFSHPKSNSLPGALLGKLAATFDSLAVNDDARVIVLRSEGTKAFCAGASFDELRSIGDSERGLEFFSGFAHVILAMRRCPKFIVTRVHGRAVGGGVGLVAASDYAIAASHAQVKLSELAIGIGPFVVGPVIEHRIGRGHFAALSIDVDWRDAAWAKHAALYSRVEDSLPALDAAVDMLVRTLAQVNPHAMRELKRIFWSGTDHWDTLLFERAATSGALILSDFSQRALIALSKS